jgi:hypothetical protein
MCRAKGCEVASVPRRSYCEWHLFERALDKVYKAFKYCRENWPPEEAAQAAQRIIEIHGIPTLEYHIRALGDSIDNMVELRERMMGFIARQKLQ